MMNELLGAAAVDSLQTTVSTLTGFFCNWNRMSLHKHKQWYFLKVFQVQLIYTFLIIGFFNSCLVREGQFMSVYFSFCSFSFNIWDFKFAFKLFPLVDEWNKVIHKKAINSYVHMIADALFICRQPKPVQTWNSEQEPEVFCPQNLQILLINLQNL